MPVAETKSSQFELDDLPELIQRFHVPGASIAVWHDGALSQGAAGVVNLNTGVEATTDTLFQIGSITKLYTTVLALQLVDEGLLALDEPVRTYLPDFKVGDAETTAKVTLRHLLTHTSGINGDYFVDAGRGEDRIEKFVSALGELPNLSPLGHMFAYCNVGFVIAGRVIEKVTGLAWDKAMRTRIAKNIGTPSFSTLPEQAMRHRTAIGHLGTPGEGLMVSPIAYLAQSNAPAGSTPMATANDIVTFGRTLLAGGTAPNGHQLISEESSALLTRPHCACPPGGSLDAIGLGAFLWNWGGNSTSGGYDVFGHDGSTIGQAAFLRIHPKSDTIVVLLTNGGDGKGMAQTLLSRIFTATADVAPPANPTPVDTGDQLGPYVGTYAKSSETAHVTLKEGTLYVTIQPSANYGVIGSGGEVDLQSVGEGRFVGSNPGMSQSVNFNFLEPDDQGRPRYLYSGVRAFTRVEN
ncbi:serine hydrolase [Parvibaculaceae bacterium PLY_AMNH_Bact1]|nr:serine hydrolase [Parvibaculaceae bacterium PLY_AMNH_Bact1]